MASGGQNDRRHRATHHGGQKSVPQQATARGLFRDKRGKTIDHQQKKDEGDGLDEDLGESEVRGVQEDEENPHQIPHSSEQNHRREWSGSEDHRNSGHDRQDEQDPFV